MGKVKVEIADGLIKVWLGGRIDSSNAEKVRNKLFDIIGSNTNPIIIDVSDLGYISSAGLRLLLKLRKEHKDMSITEASSEIYEILDITGFTQMMDVTRKSRHISIDGCKIIGRGANGIVYRLDKDQVVKVLYSDDAIHQIQHEREVARMALILGIPTAISYDIVKVDDKYGTVYELLNATSFSNILAEEPDKMDWCVKEYVSLLHKIHDTEVPENKLPDMKETVLDWAHFVKDYLPSDISAKLIQLIEDVPANNHMVHGDYHTKNVVLADGEVLLIDMDTLSVGDPVFEFGSIFNALIGFHELNHESILKFQGYSFESAVIFWDKVIREYANTDDEEVLTSMKNKARIIGYTRLIRRSIRRDGLSHADTKAEIDHWISELIELVKVTDHLSYNC